MPLHPTAIIPNSTYPRWIIAKGRSAGYNAGRGSGAAESGPPGPRGARMQRFSRDDFPMHGESGRRDWIDPTRYSVVQRFFLSRLEHLITLRRSPELYSESWHTTL